jgi:hypothetical protein
LFPIISEATFIVLIHTVQSVPIPIGLRYSNLCSHNAGGFFCCFILFVVVCLLKQSERRIRIYLYTPQAPLLVFGSVSVGIG